MIGRDVVVPGTWRNTMSDERPPGERWDRSQWPDEGTAPDAPEGETWDREQMEIDDDGTGERSGDPRQPELADDAGPLSGHGQPGGESHWERVDDD
jgi:hypothetical protein